MGNWFTKKGQAEFEKLLNECQARMAAVDDAMIFLADLLTTKKDITEVITRRSRCRPANATGNIQSLESDMEREYTADIFSVLTRMEETTQTYKMISIESVRNLLHFISQNAKSYEKVTEMKPLHIDFYKDPSVKDLSGNRKLLQDLEEAVRIGERLERKVAHLQEDLSSNKKRLATTVKENELQKRQLKNVQKEAELHKERLKRDINQLKQKEQDTEEIILQLNECKTQAQDEKVKELEQVNKELNKDSYNLKQRLEQKETELDQTRINLQETQKNLFKLLLEVEKKVANTETIKRENVELVSTINKHEETIKQYQQEAKRMQNKMAERESTLQMKDNDMKLKQDTIKTMQEKYLTLQDKYDLLESNWKSQKHQLESLRHTIEQMEMKKEVKVQLFTQNRAGLVSAVEEDLMTTLKRKINSQSTDLRCLQCVSASEIQPEIPLLLLCVTASRLGTDAQTAVQGLYLNSKTVLVIFHHKDEHALPSQASERVLTGMEFKKLGGIIDMAFLKGRGIYECELNTKSMIRVSNFITEGPNKAYT